MAFPRISNNDFLKYYHSWLSLCQKDLNELSEKDRSYIKMFNRNKRMKDKKDYGLFCYLVDSYQAKLKEEGKIDNKNYFKRKIQTGNLISVIEIVKTTTEHYQDEERKRCSVKNMDDCNFCSDYNISIVINEMSNELII